MINRCSFVKMLIKQNNSLQYIHNQSSHPPSIIKRILFIINKRLSDISSDKENFYKAAPIYHKALKNSGFNETLKFLPTIRCRFLRQTNRKFKIVQLYET